MVGGPTRGTLSTWEWPPDMWDMWGAGHPPPCLAMCQQSTVAWGVHMLSSKVMHWCVLGLGTDGMDGCTMGA